MSTAIKVVGLTKRYTLNIQRHRSYGIRDLLRELLGRTPSKALRTDEFYAVRDLSFELEPGESFALIGRNGSGKTTTLKMLAGLSKPDAGHVLMNGRVQALINLGAGFHPDLSGLDNIRNSAALMGLNARESRAIVDEVIDFAELENFIESPVATYSSGMTARLGFSVAVHLRPEILLIDEILSVGDHGFQNKCFHRLQELKQQGVTFVFVSHNHTSVIQLCDRALWLHEGQTMAIGDTKTVTQRYLDFLEEIAHAKLSVDNAKRAAVRNSAQQEAVSTRAEERATDPRGSERAGSLPTLGVGQGPEPDAIEAVSPEVGLYHALYPDFDHIDELRIELLKDGKPTDRVRSHDEVVIDYAFRLRHRVDELNVSLVFYRKDGLQLATISTLNDDAVKHIHEGRVHCSVRIPDLNLVPGEYVLVMPIHAGKSYLYRDVVLEFMVRSSDKLAWAILDFDYDFTLHADADDEGCE